MKYFTKTELEMINGTYSTAVKLKDIVKNIYNCDRFPKTDISGILHNGDANHIELFYKILKMPLTYINGREINEEIINA